QGSLALQDQPHDRRRRAAGGLRRAALAVQGSAAPAPRCRDACCGGGIGGDAAVAASRDPAVRAGSKVSVSLARSPVSGPPCLAGLYPTPETSRRQQNDLGDQSRLAKLADGRPMVVGQLPKRDGMAFEFQ